MKKRVQAALDRAVESRRALGHYKHALTAFLGEIEERINDFEPDNDLLEKFSSMLKGMLETYTNESTGLDTPDGELYPDSCMTLYRSMLRSFQALIQAELNNINEEHVEHLDLNIKWLQRMLNQEKK